MAYACTLTSFLIHESNTLFFFFLFFSVIQFNAQENLPIPIVTVNGNSNQVIYSCMNEENIYDASSSIFAEGAEIDSFQWSFGDNTYNTDSWPMVIHEYEESGIYTIELSIIDKFGNESIQNLEISILISTSPIFVLH